MAMKRCNICGEKYSETYRECPFCEEEEALREGEEIRRTAHRGKRAAGRQFSLITPTLIVLILIMAGLLVYLLRDRDGGAEDPVDKPPVSDVTPGGEDGPGASEPEDSGDEPAGVMPEDGSAAEPDTPPVTEPDQPAELDYASAAKLPDGLSLSSTDFTLKELGASSTLRASGGSGAYQWFSEDEGVAAVDQNGKVTAVSGGTVNVLVTDGEKKALCVVRISASGTVTPSGGSGDSGQSGSGTAGSLKAGAATVINGGNGVRVRSGPGTSYEALATIPNGGTVQVVRSAGDDWYEITFDHVGGVKTTGYMKGEFLKNS